MNETPLQAFRAESSSKVINVPSRHDHKTRQHIVLLRDIQQYFEHIKGIMNGNTTVLFLTDDNFEYLQPLRIAYHAGVILEVLTGNKGQGSSDHTRVSNSSMDSQQHPSTSSGQVSRNAPSSGSVLDGSHSISGNSDALRFTEIYENDQALVLHSQASPSETQTPQHPASTSHPPTLNHSSTAPTEEKSNNTYEAQLRPLQQQIHNIMKEIQQMNHQIQQTDQRAHQQQQHIEKIGQQTNPQQQHIEETRQQQQQQIDDILQQIQIANQHGYKMMQQIRALSQAEYQHKELSEQQVRRMVVQCMQESFQLQKQESDHLMLIKYRTQALLGTPFRELSIPRLFIVLPKARGVVDKDGRSCSLQFLLYYLCECGTHTMNKSSKGIHEVHMTEHPGYDLDNHSTFFGKYGLYLLAMMYMIKYGAVAAGRAVPPLLNFRVAKGIDTDKQHLNRLVDETISCLEDALRLNNNDVHSTRHSEFNPSESTHMESYLKTMEDGSVFSNLYPTTTQDRECVWICSKHRREYHESTMQQLKEYIIANDGKFNTEAGKTNITIESDALANRFYDAMGKVRWIQSLNNQWSLTALDLKL
ncbi:hypothetical protein BGZ65_009502, partial [Modicella reniformis]